MTPERWRAIEDLFLAVIDLGEPQRAALLTRAAPEVRAEVEAILAQPAGSKLLDRPSLDGLLQTAEFDGTADLTAGLTLDGKYRIEHKLGEGGMGAVYLATHLGTTRRVALKVIVPEYAARDDFLARFRREAAAAGRLRHPNVVNVTDFSVTNLAGIRLAYVVMEYLDGQTLGDY